MPGADLVARARDRFPHLAALGDLEPGPSDPPARCLALRRQQLASLRQLVAPIAGQREARAAAVHELQHRQAHHLRARAFAELHAGIQQRTKERAELHGAMVDLRNRRAAIAPAAEALEQFLPVASADLDDPATGPAWARVRLVTLAAAVAGAAAAIGSPLGPTTAEPGGDRDQVQTDLARFGALSAALSAERDRLTSELAAFQERFDEAGRWILDRTG
jgi:hypothetical protein